MKKYTIILFLLLPFSCLAEGQYGFGAFLVIFTLIPIILIWVITSAIITYFIKRSKDKDHNEIDERPIYVTTGVLALFIWLVVFIF